MRNFILGAMSALALGAVAQAAGYGGGYTMDAKGKCHDAGGKEAALAVRVVRRRWGLAAVPADRAVQAAKAAWPATDGAG